MVRGMWVDRGQWLTHHKDIQAYCSSQVSLQQVRRAKEALDKIGFSDTTTVRVSGRQFLLVTICNYDRWNPLPKPADTTADTTTDRQPTLDRQLTDTTITEEVKEVKEVKEVEKNKRALVDNSGEERTDRSEDIQAVVGDLAETRALSNIALVDRILELTGDAKYQEYYERMVRLIDHMAIERMLGAVKEARNLGEIRKTPGALLKHLMKQELKSNRSARKEAEEGAQV